MRLILKLLLFYDRAWEPTAERGDFQPPQWEGQPGERPLWDTAVGESAQCQEGTARGREPGTDPQEREPSE